MDSSEARGLLLKGLKGKTNLRPDQPHFWHGRLLCEESLSPPKVSWQSTQKPRDDHDAPDWLTASEYIDLDRVMEMKIERLADLLRASKKTVVYSGAGISRAAGIGQAARGGGRGGNKSTTAQPTFTHYALSALAKMGLIHGWVQQNHDGLPQKAGFPQECINEVHGSWYDPSNPVVLYSGCLREHECEWMEQEANTADLSVVLGTSLGGLNADQVAITPAERSLRGHTLGMVLINLQQTEHDGKSTLRVFGSSDTVFELLLTKLNAAPMPPMQPAVFTGARKVLVPYDENGNRSKTVKTWLDLSPGASIRLNPNHNIQGAKQPIYLHIGAKRSHRYRGELRAKGPGHGVVKRWSKRTVGIDLEIEGVHMLLGQWWVEAAQRGGPRSIPVVNLEPVKVIAP